MLGADIVFCAKVQDHLQSTVSGTAGSSGLTWVRYLVHLILIHAQRSARDHDWVLCQLFIHGHRKELSSILQIAGSLERTIGALLLDHRAV